MKLLVQSPTGSTSDQPMRAQLRSYMLDAVTRVKRPETELVFMPSSGMHDMHGFADLGLRYRNDMAILDAMIANAADPAIDGVIDHCFWDSALWPARQMVDKPVVGLAEASIASAMQVGRRFAIIVVNERFTQGMEDLLCLYGVRDRAVDIRPVRSIGADETQSLQWLANGEIEKLRPQIIDTARACVYDGADVVIMGCGLVSAIVLEVLGLREVDGAPIITPIVSAVKSLEAMVDLHQSGFPIRSGRGYFSKG